MSPQVPSQCFSGAFWWSGSSINVKAWTALDAAPTCVQWAQKVKNESFLPGHILGIGSEFGIWVV